MPGGNKPPDRHQRIILRQQRMAREWDLWTRGCTNKSQIAASMGVAVSTVTRDIDCMQAEALRQGGVSREKQRALRVEQLMAVCYEARNGFDRSRQDSQEYSSVKKTCERCAGMKTVIVLDEATNLDTPVDCPTCEGTGSVSIETVKTKGQAGDPSFLRTAQTCITEAAKLDGLYEPRDDPGVGVSHRTAILNIHNEINVADGGSNPFKLAPPEMILEAKAAMARLVEAARDAAEEQKTIEVQALRKDRNGD